MVETKKASPATPATKATPAAAAKPIPKARQNTIDDVPVEDRPKPTEADKAAEKAKDEATKVEAQAAEKAGRINANLIKDGDPRRVQGGVRNGEPVFFWGNFVPTQALTEAELQAADKMK
jgi:hypothetical protein